LVICATWISYAIIPKIFYAGTSNAIFYVDASSCCLTIATTRAPQNRLQHGIRKPGTYIDGTVRYGHLVVASEEPTSLHDALSNPHWKNAMDHEYSALMKNKIWHLIPPQQGQNVIDCKWVYKVKRKADGTIDRYKA
jgi:hypothetical protein